MTTDLDSLVRRLAPTDAEIAGAVGGDTRRDLAQRIMAAEPEPEAAPRARRVPRLRLALPVGVGLAAAATAAALLVPGGGSPAPAPAPSAIKQVAALSFVPHGKYIDVEIKDPTADPARYRREFAERGFDISLKLLPASPSIVNTVLMLDGSRIKPIKDGKCVTGGGACPIALRVPADFRGKATVVFGRKARPGERYDSTASAFAPGEALHGTDVRGLTVAAALRRIESRGIAVPEFHIDEAQADGSVIGKNVGRAEIPDGWYVHDADPLAPGQVRLWVGPKKSGDAGPAAAPPVRATPTPGR
ncbi:hypothetical protein [Actinomadura atramentaria]|uniref:hypothetical protein n=1 Tax=Actinomadura atramentaria TaxID=1990 RepID=UPI000374BEDA|nr:hypothetical protein [Actinomadura atramentaria]